MPISKDEETGELKVFGRIPIREFVTMFTILLVIAGAWVESKYAIAGNTNGVKAVNQKVQRLNSKIDRVEERLHLKSEKDKQELKSEIKENRRIMLRILQENRRRN